MGVAQDFERVVGDGGVVVFPADTVYGLACSPRDPAAIERMYALKGRAPDKRSAVMHFAAETLPALPHRTAAAVRELVPGPLTFVVGSQGFRVPDLPLLAGVRSPVLQTSANLSGGPDARVLADVPATIREGADLVIDGGELPGISSTVVDLTEYEDSGSWRILRSGAVPAGDVAAVLDRDE